MNEEKKFQPPVVVFSPFISISLSSGNRHYKKECNHHMVGGVVCQT